jgi:hypothetical protein
LRSTCPTERVHNKKEVGSLEFRYLQVSLHMNLTNACCKGDMSVYLSVLAVKVSNIMRFVSTVSYTHTHTLIHQRNSSLHWLRRQTVSANRAKQRAWACVVAWVDPRLWDSACIRVKTAIWEAQPMTSQPVLRRSQAMNLLPKLIIVYCGDRWGEREEHSLRVFENRDNNRSINYENSCVDGNRTNLIPYV